MASLNICVLEGGWPLVRSIPISETNGQHSDAPRTKLTTETNPRLSELEQSHSEQPALRACQRAS